jgi:hypothetical protein
MTPQEKELITSLLARLKQAGGQKDPEADALIRQAMADQPDAPYYLVQTVLIQDMALNQAQARIAELEKQLAEAQTPKQPTSFLGGLLGRGDARPSAPAPGPWSRPAAGPGPAAGPWGQPAAPPPGYAQPGYAQPGYGAPGYGQPMMGMAQGGSGFLRSAAATAAGIAGGALLFEGIQSMFGHQSGGILSGVSQQPGISETVINNYYGSDPAAIQNAALDQPSGAPGPGLQYAADQGAVPDQDYAANQDFADQDVAADDGGGFGGDSDSA